VACSLPSRPRSHPSPTYHFRKWLSSSSSWQAAQWSAGQRPIHRCLLDVLDESRRPRMSIKCEPPPWISPRTAIPSSSPSFLAGTETLAPAEPLAIARDHPERCRVAPKLRLGFLLLLVKPIELGSSQSMPTSSACWIPAAVNLLLLTISGLADELYSSVVSSWTFPCIPSPPTRSVAASTPVTVEHRRSGTPPVMLRWPNQSGATTISLGLIRWIFSPQSGVPIYSESSDWSMICELKLVMMSSLGLVNDFDSVSA
jgi:hypothetical protein